jgi:23S rRNA (adenine2503-C2)-methyltransferase
MNIYGQSIEDLEMFLESNGMKKFKAKQIYEWLYDKRISNFDDMRNISKETIDLLKINYNMDMLKLIKRLDDVDVSKFLFELFDGNRIEAVLMNHDYGNSLCISTQVGCNMGCAFCESGRLKKVRNLDAYEMVLQILQIEKMVNKRISHLVLMGIGEPFDNYDNVIKFIDIINHPKGIALGSRHITISTCGIVPKIKEFMNYDKQVNLAISLHAPNNEIRNKIMNINKVYPLEQLIDTVKEYIKKTNRRVTFEYIMLRGVNDSLECAIELAKLLRGINCYVNLIPYNETSHIEFKKSSKEMILKFYDALKKDKINVTIRREFGSKVSAACGQLRSNYEEGL